MEKTTFWALIIGIGLVILSWSLVFWMGGCGHPISQTNYLAPFVETTYPINGAENVDVGTVIYAGFDKELDPSTITTANFTLVSSSGAVTGTTSYDSGSKTAFFYPTSILSSLTNYTATLSDKVRSADGNYINAAYPWSFKTGAVTSLGGTIDASFSDGTHSGYIVYNSGTSQGKRLAVDKSGRILATGSLSGKMAIWRYFSDGTLDISFGNNGIVTSDATTGSDLGRAIVIDDPGNIYVTGDGDYAGGYAQMMIWKFDPSGKPVAGFGPDGKAVPFNGVRPLDMALDGDGNIFVCGFNWDSTSEAAGAILFKYKADGTLDTSFKDGTHEGYVARKDTLGYGEEGDAIILDPSGKILVAGSAIWRFNPDGSPDTSFGTVGVVDRSLWSSAATDGSGNIYVVGMPGIAKYTSNGALIADLDTSFDKYRSVIIDKAGKVVVAGDENNSLSGKDMIILRYNTDGTLDNNFGRNGKVVFSPEGEDQISTGSVVTDSVGRLLVVGSNSPSGFFSLIKMMIWRYR